MRLGALIAVALSLTLSPLSAHARELTANERTALKDAVATFGNAMRASDYATIVRQMPPGLLSSMADTAGATPDQLRDYLVEEMPKAMAIAKLVSFSMDVDGMRSSEAANGEPYALIPTKTTILYEGTTIETLTETIGMFDKGEWYLVRVTNPGQAAMLIKAYPHMQGIKFTADQSRVVK